MAGIGVVGPLRRVVGVLVVEHAWREHVGALRAAAGKEPDLVALDRTAESRVEVPVLVHRAGVDERRVARQQLALTLVVCIESFAKLPKMVP